jgi:hypothetical protein
MNQPSVDSGPMFTNTSPPSRADGYSIQPRIYVKRYPINSYFSGSELRPALLKSLPTCTTAALATAQTTHSDTAPSDLMF